MLLLFNSCIKPDKQFPLPMGKFYFHLHTNIDTTEADSGVVVTAADGRKFSLNVAQFYLSGIRLYKSDGSVYTLPASDVVLKTIGEEEYYVDSVPAGNYSSVSFLVGIGPAQNHTDPATYAAGNVLAPQVPSMWLGNTTDGYVFLKMNGLADTSAGNNGTADFAYDIALGTDSLLQEVKMPAEYFSVVGGSIQYVHLIVDYAKLMNGIPFSSCALLRPGTNHALMKLLVQNIQQMFRYEE